MTPYDRHIITTSTTIKDALKAINSLSGDAMTLFALAPGGRLAGTVTDGDIRRALISGAEVSDPVRKAMHRKFLAARPGDDVTRLISEGRRRKISLLPVLDKDGAIETVINLRQVKARLPLDAVMMAGGKGERLRPLTLKTPKPLLPVGGKPIIDYNIEELERCGIERIFITTNYLAEKIERHISRHEGSATIECVREPKRLGTMGSLSLIDGLRSENVLLMNSDLLTTIDFAAMYLHHIKSKSDLTMAGIPYTVSVPYALMRIKNGRVRGLEEKPTYNYFANGGVYILKRGLIGKIARGEYLDAPDFISTLISDGGKVACHPIEGTWIDIGSPDDYRYANELMERRRGMSAQ